MTNHRTIQPDARKVIVGVDTHKHVHVAVAIDTWGIRLGDRSCAADSDGYQQLITWAERHGRVAAFGIEGTGSDGAGLARGPASRAPGARSESGRPAHPSNRREVRHRGCRDRRAVGPGWPIDRHPEDRGRGGRDDAPPQGRAPDGGQSPHLGDDHADADRRHRAARAARDPPPARRPGAPQTMPRMALRHDRYADRLGETYPPGARPSLVRSLRRDRGPRPCGYRDLTCGPLRRS